MTKKMVLVSIIALVLVAAAVAVKIFFFPSLSDKFFAMNQATLRQAPANVAMVRPTHFPDSAQKPSPDNQVTYATVRGARWLVGRNVSFPMLLAVAYSYNPGRIKLPAAAPAGGFDFLVTMPREPEAHLQTAIGRQLGYFVRREIRETDVLALKVKNPNPPGLKVSTATKENVAPKNGRLYFTHMHLDVVTEGMQAMLKSPMVDKTGLTDFYDFSLAWDKQTQQQIQSGKLDQETGEKILNDWGLGLEPDTAAIEMLVVSTGAPAVAAPADRSQALLGPLNPGAERGSEGWYHGTTGLASLSIESTEPAAGVNDFTVGNTAAGRENHADWRSETFPLGPAAKGGRPMTFSFAYKLPDPVKDNDNLRVQFRFYDKATNFLDQKEFWVGSQSHDSAMTGYKTITTSGILSPPGAQNADITLSANLYEGDNWSSGTGRFDNIFVTIARPFTWMKLVVGGVALVGVAGLTVLAMSLRGRSVGRNRVGTPVPS
ncbi:MAG: TIGR03435 family protein [Verrucomicrobiae bacterium]|nr:TIGR03435 family protein [Verrucomicrobiae bacterium]